MSKSVKYLEFGPFRIDTANKLLLKGSEVVQLKPKSFDTLQLLVENCGSVLSKDEFIGRLWPDTAVEENNLTQNISVLRKVLGDGENGLRYIETIPKRGYRFIAAVRVVEEAMDELVVERHTRSRLVIEQEEENDDSGVVEPQEDQTSLAEPLTGRLSRWRPDIVAAVSVLALGLLIAAIAVAIYLRWHIPPKEDRQYPLQIVQLASFKSEKGSFIDRGNFSPDGSMITFALLKDGYTNIFIQQIDGGQPTQITKDKGKSWTPIWSPDNRQIAFFSDRNNEIGIWSIPFLGGTPKLIKKLGAMTAILSSGAPMLDCWSKDWATIYYEHDHNFFALNVTSGEVQQITNFDLETPSALFFRISPDEQRIAYLDKQNNEYKVWIMSRHGDESHIVANNPVVGKPLVWYPKGDKLTYTANQNGVLKISVAYLNGQTSSPISFEDSDGYVSDLSSDGKRLLYYTERDESDIWQVKTDSAEETQITSDVGVEFWPAVSPDGATIAYQAILGSSAKMNLEGNSILTKPPNLEDQTIHLALNGFEPQWSPDGEKVAFLRPSADEDNLIVIKAQGGEEKQLTREGVSFGGYIYGPFNRYEVKDFCWSSDSRKIAYCSKKDGAANVWIITVDGSDDTKISRNNNANLYFSCPLWSPEGRRIAYVSRTARASADGVMTWSLWVSDGEKTEIVYQTDSVLRLIGWSRPDLLIIGNVENRSGSRGNPTDVTLSQVSITEQNSQPLIQLSATYFVNIHLSPDAKTIAFVSQIDGKDNIWLLSLTDNARRRLTTNADTRTYFSTLGWSRDSRMICYGKQQGWSLIKMLDNFD